MSAHSGTKGTFSLRNSRACMVCSFVQSQQRFLHLGCPNCDAFLELRGNPDAITDCTSAVYEGVIFMNKPGDSWVSKWQRTQEYIPGLYATKVVGILPEDYIAATENAGVTYVARDGSAATDEQ